MKGALLSSAVAAGWRAATPESVIVRFLRRARQALGAGITASSRAFVRAGAESPGIHALRRAAQTSRLTRFAIDLGTGLTEAPSKSRLLPLLRSITEPVAAASVERRVAWAGAAVVAASLTHALLAEFVPGFEGWLHLVTPAALFLLGAWLAYAPVSWARALAFRFGAGQQAVHRRSAESGVLSTRVAVAWGAAAGVAYTMSPLGVASLATSAALVWMTARTLPTRERHWFVFICAAAVTLRVAAVAVLPLASAWNGEMLQSFSGDAVYAIQRSLWIRNTLLGIPTAPLQFFEAYRTGYGYTGYHHFLAYLQVLVGAAPYGLHMFSATVFLGAAIMMFRVVRRGFGEQAALVGLALVLFMPSLFVWSISPLKESMSFFLLAAMVVGAARFLGRGSLRSRVPYGVLAAACVWAMTTLRSGALAMGLGGLAVGLVLVVATASWRAAWLVACLAVGGFWYVDNRREDVKQMFVEAIVPAAQRHIGHVLTPGHSYRLLPTQYYVNREPTTLTFDESVAFVGRAVPAFLIEPSPFSSRSRLAWVLMPQQAFWYLLLLCSMPGAVAGLRKDRILVSMLLGVFIAGAAVIAPASGNVGTLVRHRDLVAPFVIWLGALGIVTLLAWRQPTRPGPHSSAEAV